MTVTNGFLRSSSESMTPSAIMSEAAGSMWAPSATMRLPRLRMFSIPGFIVFLVYLRGRGDVSGWELRRRGFKVARLQGCKVARLQGFKVARLQGFKVSRLQG